MKSQRKVLHLCILATAFITDSIVSAGQTAGNLKIALPAPTGPYAVGRQSFHWIDHSRKESLTDTPDDDRELMVHIWYPAEPATKMVGSPYIPKLSLVKSGLDDSQYSILSTVQTHTFANAKLLRTRRRYPALR